MEKPEPEPSRSSPLAPLLDAQGVVILDGGLATELEARGFDLDDELWSARLLAEAPEAVRQLHLDYLLAGADCVVGASYQATTEGFVRRGRTAAEAVDLLLSSVRLALEARALFWSDARHRVGRVEPLVAASVGPYGAARADGSEYTGAYDLDEEGLVAFHRRRFGLLAASGADLLACETIPSAVEARALARLLASHPDVWAWMSFSCRDAARLADGSEFESVIRSLEDLSNLVAVGINCTAPEFVPGLLRCARAATGKPIVVYPNSGERYEVAERRWGSAACEIDLVSASREWRQLGASLVGGCCRVGPAQIAAIRAALLG